MAAITNTTYYHGGIAGLVPGDQILPPNVTGEASKQADEEFVYVTTDITYAAVYAAGVEVDGHRLNLDYAPGHNASAHNAAHDGVEGWVYRVSPDDELEPGLIHGLEYRTTSATVEEIELKLTGEDLILLHREKAWEWAKGVEPSLGARAGILLATLRTKIEGGLGQ